MKTATYLTFALALLTGCDKSKPTSPAPVNAPGTPAPETGAPAPAAKTPEKPNYLANVLKPRAEIATGHRREEYSSIRIHLNRDGTRLVASLNDAKVTQVWDLRDQPKKLQEMAGSAGPMSPDGKLFVRNGGINAEVVDAATGKVVSTIEKNWGFQFHAPDALNGYRYHNPDTGKGSGYLVHRFNPATGKMIDGGFTIPITGPNAICWGAADEIVEGDLRAKKVKVWSVATKKVVREFALPVGDKSVWSNFSVTPDGKWLSLGVTKTCEVFDAQTGEAAGVGPEVGFINVVVPTRDLILAHHVFGDKDFKVQKGFIAFDFRKQKPAAFLPSDGFAAAASDDGRVAATSTNAGNLLVWDLSVVP